MKKLTEQQKQELFDMVGNNANADELQKKAKEFGVLIPNDIFSIIKKWDNARNKALKGDRSSYTMKARRKMRVELFGRNLNGGAVGKLLDWIRKQ